MTPQQEQRLNKLDATWCKGYEWYYMIIHIILHLMFNVIPKLELLLHYTCICDYVVF